jgi:phage-related protein
MAKKSPLPDYLQDIVNLQKQIEILKKGVDQLAEATSSSFNKMTLSLTGFVTAGVAASNFGTLFGYQMAELSRQIASLFLPVIQTVSESLQTLLDWFRELTGEQQAWIARVIEASVVGLGFVAIFPKLVGGINLVIGVVKGLVGALAGVNVVTGGILPIIGLVLAAFTGIGLASDVAGSGLGGLLDAFQPLLDVFADLKDTVGEALKPLIPVAQEVVQALAPVLAGVVEFAGAFAELLAPAIGLIGKALVPLLLLLKPLISFFTLLARTISSILKPVLDALAWTLGLVSKEIAVLVGVDLEPPTKRAIKPTQRQDLTLRSGGFGSVAGAWERIAQASVRSTIGKTTPEKTLDVNVEQRDIQKEIRNKLNQLKPPVGK